MSMIDIAMESDGGLRRLLNDLRRQPAAVHKAVQRAMSRTLKMVVREMVRRASRETGIKQQEFKDFRRVGHAQKDGEGRAWLGTAPLPAHLAGRVVWSPRMAGAMVAGSTMAGTFYRRIFTGERKVWIRTRRNASEGHALYHPERASSKSVSAALRGRLPVSLVGLDLEEQLSSLPPELAALARDRFTRELRQQLRFLQGAAGG